MTGRSHGLIWRMLHLPLLLKVLVANCVITALMAPAGTLLTIWHVQGILVDPHYDVIVLLTVVDLAISLVVNFLAIRLVLTPLDRIEAAVDSVRQGRQVVSIRPGLISDERFDRLISAFNRMLETMEQNAEQVRHLPQTILHHQEQERQRIARELHDEVAQTLTSLLLYLKLLERSQNPEEAQRVQNLRKLAAHALEEIRGIAMALHPKILDEWGLEAALGRRVDELNSADSTRITFQVTGGMSDCLPKELELVFYRVAQEALSNIARHAHARNARITLKREANWLTLEILDDGVGFDAALAHSGRPRGMGLSSMRERLGLVGGEFMIESQIGHGTRLVARAPVSPVLQGNNL